MNSVTNLIEKFGGNRDNSNASNERRSFVKKTGGSLGDAFANKM